MFKNQRSENGNSFKKPKENNRWKKMNTEDDNQDNNQDNRDNRDNRDNNRENNRWKKMNTEDDNQDNRDNRDNQDNNRDNRDNRFNNSGFASSFAETNDKNNRFKHRHRGRIHKSRYSKEDFNSKMNNERGATLKKVSHFQGNLIKLDDKVKKNKEKKIKQKQRKQDRKSKYDFIDEQPKINKSNKDFILNYYCQEQEDAEEEEEAEEDTEADPGAFIQQTSKSIKDIISF